jgi:ribosomal protein S12 methylthiotransferase
MEKSSKQKPLLANKSAFSKALVVNLGCPKNLVDTEKVCAVLNENGVSIVSEKENFDCVFINTCCFIKSARDESHKTIRYFLDIPEVQVVVFGCYAHRYTNELSQMFPEAIIVDDPFPFDAIQDKYFSHNNKITSLHRKISSPFTAYLKIADGCNRACSFCLIPSIKGTFVSTPIHHLLEEAKDIARSNRISEINLIAQDTAAYGNDLLPPASLAMLLRELSSSNLFPWIRILYLFPTLSFEQLDEIFSIPNVLPYLDIPLQHITAPILRSMNRPDTIQTTLDTLRKLRNKHPQLAIRSTFIVGFPGETEEHFQQLCQFLSDFRFHRAGFFAYSDEVDVPSYSLDNKIDEAEKNRRMETAYAIQEAVSLSYNQALMGKNIQVLAESWNGISKVITGRSMWDAPDIDQQVRIKATSPAEAKKIGSILQVKVTEVQAYMIEGVIVE